MQPSIKKLPKSEIEITGEVPVEDFARFIVQSSKHLSEHLEMPGFRKGHIPEKIALERIGEDALLQEAAELALQDAYPKILESEKIEAIGRPEVAITKLARGNALGFKIKTAVLPEIKLPEYKTIAAQVPSAVTPEITAKEINESLEYLQKSRAAHTDKSGAEKPILPELNDEFAKSVGKFNTLEELKKTIGDNLRHEKEMKAKEKRRVEILQKISDAISWELPDIMLEAEKNKILSETKGNIENMGIKWEDYLKNIKKTEAELKKEWAPEAEKRVKYGLIIRAIGSAEKLDPAESEINDYADKLMKMYGGDNTKIDRNRLTEYAVGVLSNEKILRFLESCGQNTEQPTK